MTSFRVCAISFWLVFATIFARPLVAQDCDVEENPPPQCFVVTVTPDGGSASRPFYSSGHSQTFVVRNAGQVADMYDLACSGTNSVTCTETSVGWVSLFPGDSVQVSVFYSVGAPGSGTLTLTATGSTSTAGGPSDGGGYTITVTVPPGAPVVDVTPFNSDNYVVGRCAASCFAAVHAQSTVPYFSLDAPRSLTLVYNGDRVNPKPFIHVNVSPDLGYGQTPDEYRLHALINGALVVFLNNEDTLRFDYTGSAPVRIGGQLDASSYATGAYDLEIRVTALYAGGPIENVVKTRLLVVNGTTAAVARGWTVGGVQRLFVDGDSALVVDGDGSAIYFRKSGASFVTPPGDFSQLVTGIPGGGSGWTRRYPDSTKIVFNSMGRMIEMRDRFNNVITVVHSANGDTVKQVKDPLNLAIALSYDGNGLDAVTDPMGRVTQVTVDASKRLTLIQDPDGIGTSFGYDGSMRLLTVTNRGGRTTSLAYDAQTGKLASVTAPTITLVKGNGTDTTAAPVTTFAAWQERGVPYSGTGTPFTPIPVDSAYAVLTDAGGHATRFTVNRWGTPARTRDHGGYVTTVTFDDNGLPIRVVQPTGAKDSTVYNANGLPTYLRSNQDSAVLISYGAWALPSSTQGFGRPTVINWISNGRIDSTAVVAGNSKSRYYYDVRGRPDSVKDIEGHLIQRTWYTDARGNRSKDSLPGARVTTYGYDTYGRQTTVTPPGGPTVTTYYSIINRTDSTRDGVNPVATRYGYDSLLLRSVTDPKGQQYTFTYNALGWLVQRIDPVNAAELYAYDRDGLLRRYTNRRGDTVQTTYDTLHRPVTKFGENTDTASWSYATNGLSMTATSPVAAVTHALRVDGRLDSVRTQMAGQSYKVRYTYTTAGLLDSVVPTGAGLAWQARSYRYHSTKFTLDSIRLGTLVTQTATNHVGQMTTVTLPGGDVVTRRTTSVHSAADITTAASYDEAVTRYMGYNAKGQLWRHIFSDGLTGKEYLYDGLGRLKEDWWIHYDGPQNICNGEDLGPDGNLCTEPPVGWFQDSSVTFSYDSVGNRRDKGGQYGTGNRIETFDNCTYLTDADGNVTQRACGADTVRFAWTAENRLRRFILLGDTIKFDYDASGTLVRKRVGAVVRHFLWHGEELLAELNGTGTAKVAEYSYYPGLDNPHAVIVGTTAYFAHRDAVGNVIALTDTAKQVRRTYEYDAWGKSTGGEDYAELAGADRARFKGALWVGNETELYYMRARWYEPRSGRFLTEDPLGVAASINPYVFAGDDPINHADPTGLFCEEVTEWRDGPVGSGYVDVLKCTDIHPADIWTIERYLGRPDGRLRDMWGRWEWPTPDGGTWGRYCPQGFGGGDCSNIASALAELVLHSDDQCSALGLASSRRFQAGRYIYRARAGYIAFPRNMGLRFDIPIPGLTKALILTRNALVHYNLTNAIAHEEWHFWTRRWHRDPGDRNDEFYQMGFRCGGPELR